jgi:dUTP pyrophosphatase
MKLLLKTENTDLTNLYSNHQHYNPGDSGLDLFCPETITINPGETVKINLQINCEALHDTIENTNVSYYLYPRSSIIKTPLRLANSVGIIDAGYRGDIIACVDNIKSESYTVNKGDRLFQICSGNLEPIQFQLVNELSNTQRGSGGFGSTGQ